MKIIGVVVKQRDMVIALPAPNRHHHCIWYMCDELNLRPPIVGEQGFYLENGKFLSRKEAKVHATRNGQLKKETDTDELFSEDLW